MKGRKEFFRGTTLIERSLLHPTLPITQAAPRFLI